MIIPEFAILVFTVLAALLYAEATGRSWKLIPKMALSSGFLLVAWDHGAIDSVYGRWILVALLLSWAGDLILGFDRAFLAGLISFATAHLAYVVAFQTSGVGLAGFLTGGLATLAIGLVVFGRLRPHLSDRLARAVGSYIVIIGLMVGAAAGTGMPAIWLPAAAFAVSDIAVARQRFLRSSLANKIWGLPLYFLAQYALATTV